MKTTNPDGKSGLRTLKIANQNGADIDLIVPFYHSCKLVIFINHDMGEVRYGIYFICKMKVISPQSLEVFCNHLCAKTHAVLQRQRVLLWEARVHFGVDRIKF